MAIVNKNNLLENGLESALSKTKDDFFNKHNVLFKKAKIYGGFEGFADNLNLGFKGTAMLGVAAFAGAALFSKLPEAWNAHQKGLQGYAEYVGNDPATYYDAAPNVDRRTGDKSLGATGELVFGLRNSRHGGK